MDKIIASLIFFGTLLACDPPPPDIKEKIKKYGITDPIQDSLAKILLEKDSLLFDCGFNQSDTALLRTLTSKDFEFYHDQGGITESQADFIQSIASIGELDYHATRELDTVSLKVYFLKKDGEIYGAIQEGRHNFYAQKGKEPKYQTSTAQFTHLWILEEGDWKLKRVLSYDHHSIR